MDYATLIEVNSRIKTIDIKGKEYAEVNQRIMAFRELYPNGAIITEILGLDDGICTIKATILDSDGNVLGMGHAQEKESNGYINKQSFVENCETSAVGRALGMLGIGIDASIASFEEVASAINNQGKDKRSSDDAEKAPHGELICTVCSRPVSDETGKDGELWIKDQIAEYATRKYGRVMCAPCTRAMRKAQTQLNPKKEQSTDED